MFYPYISEFNWFDIVIIIVILRMCYIGIKKGVITELFKLTNVVLCSFVALHFYFLLGEFLHAKIPAFPTEAAATFSFVVLVFLITVIFRVLREATSIFFKSDSLSAASKWIGAMLGFCRSLIICGLIAYWMLIAHNHYLEMSARSSITGSKLVKIPVRIYEVAFHGIVAKLLPQENLNQEVVKVIEKRPEPNTAIQ